MEKNKRFQEIDDVELENVSGGVSIEELMIKHNGNVQLAFAELQKLQREESIKKAESRIDEVSKNEEERKNGKYQGSKEHNILCPSDFMGK